MKHIIDQYIKEDFRYYKGNFSFSCPTLHLEVAVGEVCSGYFELMSDTVIPEEIVIQTTHEWLKVEVYESYESKVSFFYSVEIESIRSDAVTTGEILVLTNMGECCLNYTVQKMIAHIVVNNMVITTLVQFADFAKNNWREAVSIFYTEEGEQFFSGLGSEEAIAYLLFSSIPRHACNVDEFLIYLKAKDEIHYQAMETAVTLELQNATMRQVVTILKEGYGAVHMRVSTNADFIRVTQNYLTEDDFVLNECRLQYAIDLTKLQKGLNEGVIFVESDYQTMPISISVHVPLDQVFIESVKGIKTQNVALMKLYFAYRMKKIEQKEWFEESLEIIEEVIDDYPQDFLAQLYHVQLLVVNGRKNEATWLLSALAEQLENSKISEEIYTYYMYLSTLTESEEDVILSTIAKISILYDKHPTFWIAWLLGDMKEEYQKDLSTRLELFQIHGANGCNSPFLYLEVLQIYNNQPNLLEDLDEFILETIYFGMKYQWIEPKLFQRVQELSIEIREYSRINLAVLTYCYEKECSIEVLHTICRILIQENLVGEEHYKWYLLAVEKQVRVTNIYEHYMSSMPLENWDEIAKTAVLYFAYSNQLPYEQKTLLYLYVLKHKQDLQEIIEVYETQMKEFVIEQILSGRVNEKLAKLYELVFTQDMMTTELVESFVKMIFQEEVLVYNSNIERVIVVHPNILEESVYPIINGKALITVYHPKARILLEDRYQNRSLRTSNIRRERLLHPKEWYQMILSFAVVTSQLDWYLANEVTSCSKITLKNVLSIARLMANERISSKWKGNVRKYLAKFYYEHDMIEELDEMIGLLKIEETDKAERSEFLQFMIKRGFYKQGYEIIRDYGCESHDVKLVVRLCKRLLGVQQIEYDPVILAVAVYAYENQEYDRSLLAYLVKYFVGNFYMMKQIYFTCRQQGVEASTLARRIILRILFCKWNEKEQDIIYNDYIRLGEDTEYKIAYLNYEALLFLGNEKVVISSMVEEWVQNYQKNGISQVMSLGIVKYFSDKTDSMTQIEEELVVELIKPLIAQKIYFPFFKNFTKLYEPISNFSDDTMVVYQSTRSNNVAIYYNEYSEGGEENRNRSYKKILLKPVFGQFYIQNFLLFLGEGIHYYIVEEQYGIEVETKRDTIMLSTSQVGDILEDTRSRYHKLNKMQVHFVAKEIELVEKEVDDYLKKEYLTKMLFNIL